jgi:hypothetical protein
MLIFSLYYQLFRIISHPGKKHNTSRLQRNFMWKSEMGYAILLMCAVFSFCVGGGKVAHYSYGGQMP